MNIDPAKVDTTYLYERFHQSGYEFHPEPADVTDAAAVLEKAEQADVIIASMERWDEEKLSAVDGKVRLIQNRRSDIVSLHIPSTPETKGSIDNRLFSLMKDGAYLINTCRGDVLREEDLITALKSGKIAGAGLDVLTKEPPESDNELMKMDNVFISSHMGAESRESGLRSQKIMADNIEQYANGKMPENVCNKNFLRAF